MCLSLSARFVYFPLMLFFAILLNVSRICGFSLILQSKLVLDSRENVTRVISSFYLIHPIPFFSIWGHIEKYAYRKYTFSPQLQIPCLSALIHQAWGSQRRESLGVALIWEVSAKWASVIDRNSLIIVLHIYSETCKASGFEGEPWGKAASLPR
jgi:hypothetical protein